MTEVDQGKDNMMSRQEVNILAVKADYDSPELVNPGETTLGDETALVYLGIEQAFATRFWRLATTLIFWCVGDKAIVEAGFASILGIESLVGIEIGTRDQQAQT